VRGSTLHSPRQLRPTPARLELANLHQAFEGLQIDQEDLFDPVPDQEARHTLFPLEVSLSSPPVPGRFLFETTPTSSPPISLRLTPLTPSSESNSSTESSDNLVETPAFIHLPHFIPLLPPIHSLHNPPTIRSKTLLPAQMSTAPTFHMPLCGMPNMPKFDGSPRELLHYFEDVKRLTDAAGLHGQSRIDATLRYVPRDDAETWEMLKVTKGGDYDAFINAVKPLYPGCERDAQYARSNLDFIIADQAGKIMHSQTDLRQYYRSFLRVSLN
jgi:hypothetical protein